MTAADDRADRALVNAGLADTDGRRVSAAEFAETIQHRAGQGVTYTFTPEVVHGLLRQRDRLATAKAAAEHRAALLVGRIEDVLTEVEREHMGMPPQALQLVDDIREAIRSAS